MRSDIAIIMIARGARSAGGYLADARLIVKTALPLPGRVR
jgi:hypothetical protein